MAFRPCIDLRNGRVVQIVGGTLSATSTVINHISPHSAADFAALYQRDKLYGGHVIMLGPGSEEAARAALRAYPQGLQVGGGIGQANADAWLEAGASHVIATSWLFPEGKFALARLAELSRKIGRERLVVDLSCRRGDDGAYRVAIHGWQTITDFALSRESIGSMEEWCAELLVHAADVEGRRSGIDEALVRKLGEWVSIPTTYAGGATRVSDIDRVWELSHGKIDLTIGSALDIFGGDASYDDAARKGLHAPMPPANPCLPAHDLPSQPPGASNAGQ